VVGSKAHGKYLEIFLDGRVSPQEILSALINKGVKVDRIEVSPPTLNELFIWVVKEGR